MLIQLVLVIVIWGPFSCNFGYLRWDTMQCGLQKYWGQNTYNGNKEFYFNITEDFVLEKKWIKHVWKYLRRHQSALILTENCISEQFWSNLENLFFLRKLRKGKRSSKSSNLILIFCNNILELNFVYLSFLFCYFSHSIYRIDLAWSRYALINQVPQKIFR